MVVIAILAKWAIRVLALFFCVYLGIALIAFMAASQGGPSVFFPASSKLSAIATAPILRLLPLLLATWLVWRAWEAETGVGRVKAWSLAPSLLVLGLVCLGDFLAYSLAVRSSFSIGVFSGLLGFNIFCVMLILGAAFATKLLNFNGSRLSSALIEAGFLVLAMLLGALLVGLVMELRILIF